MSISSRWMYCQTSSSVQLLIGKTRMLSPLRDPTVVEVPQLGPLVLRVPAVVLVAEAEDPLLGPRLSPRHVGRRRRPRRNPPACQRLLERLGLHDVGVVHRAVVEGVDALLRRPPGWCGRSDLQAELLARSGSRNSIISRNFHVVSTCSSGNGTCRDGTPCAPGGACTDESLPIEYSITGLLELGDHLAHDVDASASSCLRCVSRTSSSRPASTSVPIDIATRYPWPTSPRKTLGRVRP